MTEVLETERDSDPEDHFLTQLSASSDVSANNNSSPRCVLYMYIVGICIYMIVTGNAAVTDI